MVQIEQTHFIPMVQRIKLKMCSEWLQKVFGSLPMFLSIKRLEPKSLLIINIIQLFYCKISVRQLNNNWYSACNYPRKYPRHVTHKTTQEISRKRWNSYGILPYLLAFNKNDFTELRIQNQRLSQIGQYTITFLL